MARAAGVSPATVSRALRGLPGVSEATRRSVNAAAERMGYVASPAAASLSTGRTHTVGILSPWVTRWFFSAVIDGALNQLTAASFDVLLSASDPAAGPPKWNLRGWAKRVDGILGITLPGGENFGAQLSAMRTPVVLVGDAPAGVPNVDIDDVGIGRVATEHLLSLGHRRIGFVGGGVGPFSLPVAARRRAGYERALADAGIASCPEIIVDADFSIAGGIDAGARILRLASPPTAIVAVCDETALGLIHALRDAGLLVPRDISVIGVDDHDVAGVSLLTTIAQPVRRQGLLAAQMLLQLMAGESVESVVLPTTLVVRETTARFHQDAHYALRSGA